MRRRDRRIDAAAAALILVAIPPTLLLATGSPLDWGAHLSPAIRVAADLVWAIWAWCVVGVTAATATRVARRDLERSPSARALEGLSIRLAALVLAGIGLVAPTSASASSQHRASPTPVVAAAPTSSSGAVAPVSQETSETYTVREGDCLWSIADAVYGDGGRWTTIAWANLGRVMDDGRLFVDPSLIMPGWQLVLPDVPSPKHLSSPTPAQPSPAASPAPPPATNSSHAALHLDAQHPNRQHSTSDEDLLGDGAVVIAGSLGSGAAILGLLRRRRRRLGPLFVGVDDPLLDTDIDLARLEILPTTNLLERAAVLCVADDALREPGLLELTETGARLFTGSRPTWRAEPEDLIEPCSVDHAPCAVIPLGADGSATWSLLVPPGSVAILGGPRAQDLLDDAIALQPEFAWGHLIAARRPGAEPPEMGSLVVEQRSEPIADAAGIWLDDEHAAAVVSDGAVELPGLGIRLEPQRLSPSARALLEDEPTPVPELLADQESPPSAEPLPRGPVRVRILSAQPHVEGLSNPIEPRRERRAVELIAYLALHRPDPITGDRLRARVLGSSAADAAAKTLFNVASAARRSLGCGLTGEQLLPPASRQGTYQISDEVHTDLDELFEHLAAAELSAGEEAIAHLRAGLELIESEPLSAILVGWEWFVAEGHQGRLEAAVERSCERLVSLCVANGLAPLAERCLERAVLAVPYSETMAAAAMEVAAARGDADGLRRAFDAYGRIVEEIEPGSWPLPSAEDRYLALRSAIEEDQASLAAMDAAPLSTRPSAPAAL